MLNGQALSTVQAARNPGYAGTPTQQMFFGERGSQSFEGFALVDLAVTYAVPVWRSAQPWIKFEIVQRAEQPEADRVGHDDHRRRGERA